MGKYTNQLQQSLQVILCRNTMFWLIMTQGTRKQYNLFYLVCSIVTFGPWRVH